MIDTATIEKEIASRFALNSSVGGYVIQSVGEQYPAWVIRNSVEYGVAIEYSGKDIFESFSSAQIETRELLIEDNKIDILYLFCDFDYLRNEFAKLCADFVNPGEDGENRKLILQDPVSWWERWKTLLGNNSRDIKVYDVIGELLCLKRLMIEQRNPIWAAMSRSSHDIETDNESYEVKSTIKKSTTEIHVSSQFQFEPGKRLYLIFNRFEESKAGISINDLLLDIEKLNHNNVIVFEKYLDEIGLKKGNHYRDKRYNLLECRRLEIDDNFPKIVASSFVGGKIPDNITHIEYNVDLNGLEYDDWK